MSQLFNLCNGWFLRCAEIDVNQVVDLWIAALASFYSQLKLWWCVKRWLILIVELFVACLKDIFDPAFHWWHRVPNFTFFHQGKMFREVEETSMFRKAGALPHIIIVVWILCVNRRYTKRIFCCFCFVMEKQWL